MSDRHEYDLHVEGVEAFDLPAVVLRDLCHFLFEGGVRAARLAGEGRSLVRGTPPPWLAPTSDIRIDTYKAGSLNLSFSAPSLRTAAPEVFAQQDFFANPVGSPATAIDLLMRSADDAANGRRDSDNIDAGMLDILRKSRGLFDRGVNKVSLSRRDGGGAPFEFTEETLAKFDTLANEIPAPRVHRVSGVLDSIAITARTLLLRLSAGGTLRGFAGSLNLAEYRGLLGEQVVVEGQVTFRPSGAPLRIDLDFLTPASARDGMWSKAPRADVSKAKPVGADLAAVFGKWPGDESDEEIFAALSEMS